VCGDVEETLGCLDVATHCANVYVRTPLDLCDLGLSNAENLGYLSSLTLTSQSFLNERYEVGVDRVCLRGRHAVR
jgi:hypothetical protein